MVDTLDRTHWSETRDVLLPLGVLVSVSSVATIHSIPPVGESRHESTQLQLNTIYSLIVYG